MTTQNEALKLALEALKLSLPAQCGQSDDMYEQEWREHFAAIRAVREALAQPEQAQEPQRWSAYFEGDERVYCYDSAGEACGEKECDIDNEFEPGTEVEYCLAPMISAKEQLRTMNAFWIGEYIFELMEERLSDDMMCEDPPLSIDKTDQEDLGKLVIDFLCARAKTIWWTVDHKREEKRVYVAGGEA